MRLWLGWDRLVSFVGVPVTGNLPQPGGAGAMIHSAQTNSDETVPAISTTELRPGISLVKKAMNGPRLGHPSQLGSAGQI